MQVKTAKNPLLNRQNRSNQSTMKEKMCHWRGEFSCGGSNQNTPDSFPSGVFYISRIDLPGEIVHISWVDAPSTVAVGQQTSDAGEFVTR